MADGYDEPFVLDFPNGQRGEDILKKAESDYSKSEIDAKMSSKADTADLPTVPITVIQKNGTSITPIDGTVNITVPTQASDINAATAAQGDKADTAIQGIKVNSSTVNPDVNKVVNITVPTTAADVSALPDTTKYAAALSLTINSSTYVITGQLKDQNGDNLGTAQTIDLPLESVVVGGSYDSQTKKVVLTLQNGNTIEFSVADLVYGLQTEFSETNKLNPAYINYDNTHRAVSDAEKSEWNGKQDAIDSSHKLSADLVDDTGATNKFATAAQLQQISTNENNISYNTNMGVKNLCKPNVLANSEVTATVNADLSITVTCNTTALREVCIFTDLSGLVDGQSYILSGCDGGAYNSTYGFAVRTSGGMGKAFESDGETTFIKSSDMVKMDLIIRSGQNWTKTFYPMIRPAEINDPTYKPYAMSNVELTNGILNWSKSENRLLSSQVDVNTMFDVDNSSVYVYTNEILKRVVIATSLKVKTAISSPYSTIALAELPHTHYPIVSINVLTSNFRLTKNDTNNVIAFTPSADVAVGTLLKQQLEYTYY